MVMPSSIATLAEAEFGGGALLGEAGGADDPMHTHPTREATSIFAPPSTELRSTPKSLAAPTHMSAAINKPATVVEAFDMLRVPQNLRSGIMLLVGADSEDDDPELLAHIPAEVLSEAMG